MSETKEFHIGDVLSIVPGRLLSPDHMGGVYKILEWMTGQEGLMTHQLPRVSRECEPYLREQFPELTSEEVPDTINSRETADAYLTTLYPRHGERVSVARIPDVAHTAIDPISELQMHHPGKTIVLLRGEGGEQ